MHIDPAGTSSVQLPVHHKPDDIRVGNAWSKAHLCVVIKKALPASFVPNQYLPVNQFVPNHLLSVQEDIQFRCLSKPTGEELNPDRGIDQDSHATRFFCLPGAGFSRRLGTSVASGSEPRRARSR